MRRRRRHSARLGQKRQLSWSTRAQRTVAVSTDTSVTWPTALLSDVMKCM